MFDGCAGNSYRALSFPKPGGRMKGAGALGVQGTPYFTGEGSGEKTQEGGRNI